VMVVGFGVVVCVVVVGFDVIVWVLGRDVVVVVIAVGKGVGGHVGVDVKGRVRRVGPDAAVIRVQVVGGDGIGPCGIHAMLELRRGATDAHVDGCVCRVDRRRAVEVAGAACSNAAGRGAPGGGWRS
jgi:hypothetical protein